MDDSKTRPRIGLEIEKVIDSSEKVLRLVKKNKTRTYSGASRYKLLEIRVFQVSSKQLLQDFLRDMRKHQATSARQIQVD